MAAENKEAAVFHNYSDDASSISLLRRLRAGAAVDFVHHVDVCSAAPSDLVANLEPAPGTNSAWYFYCPKKYKNAQGKASGHRQRAIGGGDTCWHAEARPKEVAAAGGGTACNLSYGRKDSRSFNRLGWCMMEYDDNTGATGGGGDCVLCKIYPSSRAQAKKMPPSSSKSAATSKAAKRKSGGDHPEVRPAKLFYDQDADFLTGDYPMPSTVAQVNVEECIGFTPEMFRGEEEQQLSTEPTQDGGEFVDTPYGLLPYDVAQINVEEWIGGMKMFGGEGGHGLEQQTSEQDNGFVEVAEPTVEDLLGQEETTFGEGGGMPSAVFTLPDADFFDGLERERVFGVQEEQIVRTPQQPRAEPDPLAEFVKSQWTACQQQESQWMTMQRLPQGPPSFLIC